MRILWIAHFIPYPPQGSGNLQRTHHLLKEAAARHEVHLIALHQRALLPTDEDRDRAVEVLSGLVASVATFPIRSDGSKLRWSYLVASSFFKAQPYDIGWFANPAMTDAIRSLVQSGKFQLVHVDTIGLTQYAMGIPGTPMVLTHHNVESQMMRRRARQEAGLAHRIYFGREASKLERLERQVAPRAAVNLVVSPLDGERLAEIAPGASIRVVENGVDTTFFAPSGTSAPKPRSLLFASTMNWYPNASAARFFVREIWPRLTAEDGDQELILVGRDPPPEVRAAAAGDRRIKTTGFVPDVRPFFDEAEVYVCPIRDGGGTRLKILDALAMGKPMVATRLSVEGLELVDGIHYLAADTPEEFVKQIRRLQREPELRRRLARQSRDFIVERYSWNRIGQHLDEAYEFASLRGWKAD